MDIKYSIVIPVYNEQGAVMPLEKSIRDVMESLKKPYEIIFINDGSDDGTFSVLKRIKETSPNLHIVTLEENSGQTASLRIGLQLAKGDVIISMDGDLQNDPNDIPVLLDKLKEGYDCVCGWRRKRYDSIWKKVASRIANTIQGRVFKSNLHDISCTLRAYKREALKDVDLTFDGAHRFIPYLMLRKNRRVAEVEVRHHPRKFGKSKYNPLKILKTSKDFFKLLGDKKI